MDGHAAEPACRHRRCPGSGAVMTVLLGELSPMPPRAGPASAPRFLAWWAHTGPGAGHVVRHGAPGGVLAAVDRLVAP